MNCFADPPVLVLADWVELFSSRLREDCWAALSATEEEQYGHFHLTADRERFLAGRGLLRQLLGVWLGKAPGEVVIYFDRYGKPYCAGGPEFNLSHSGSLILFALHACRPVGVDLERIDGCFDWYSIATRLWGLEVAVEIAGHRGDERHSVFFQRWCNYEAKYKASGLGLAASPMPSLLSWNTDLWSVLLPSGYCGSVALLGGSLPADQPF